MEHLSDSRRANLAARAIHESFCDYRRRFGEITRRARGRFESQDWHGLQADANDRLNAYRETVAPLVESVEELLGERLDQKIVWAGMKAVYSGLITDRDDWELGETFFNSITRRVFSTVGVDAMIEFVDTDFDEPPTRPDRPVHRTHTPSGCTVDLVEQILSQADIRIAFADIRGDAGRVAHRIEEHLREEGALKTVDRAEFVRAIFYRGSGAYLVGRIFSGAFQGPLIIALCHGEGGLCVDAVLLDENSVSILFSFSRSYFFVDAGRPHDLVQFLRSVMPRKRRAELYISIGHNKHGKTALYRDLLHHLKRSDEVFEIARGRRGMVMTVFEMAGYDVVFKLIKDQFDRPKRTTRDRVRDRYRLVFRHDRAGRLVDAQEFEHLRFDRHRFSDVLLDELTGLASRSVEIVGEHLIVKHAYVERRVYPLDLYLRDANPGAARAAVIDYGNAIKDLAATNIFPGDMMLKNFGVTRHGRVVFYDYDELCLLENCRFRRVPPARTHEDEMAAGAWYGVSEYDVFPEELERFVELVGDLRRDFLEHHADLFGVEFWRGLQERFAAGELVHLLPYSSSMRFEPGCQKDA